MQHILWWIFLSMLTGTFAPLPTSTVREPVTTDVVEARLSRPADLASAGFAVAYKGAITSARINMVTALPGDSVKFDVVGQQPSVEISFVAEGGSVRPDPDGNWWWHAPVTPGLSRIVVKSDGADSMLINAFVLVESRHVGNGVLNGYQIGEYPTTPLRGLDIYLPPRGFIEVTPENTDTHVSPNFRLGQFVAKQAGGYPKYVVLTERLILKLEYLLSQLNARGIAANSFFVMSGYRTPSYNKAIGNVRYSRHVYGAAADIFVDENPRDGQMDDLNGDKKIDVQDAQVLVDIVNAQLNKPDYVSYIGGLGRYSANANHGPFVHVDIRDRPARW